MSNKQALPVSRPTEWAIPAGRSDWLLGTGATRTERALVWTLAIAGMSIAIAMLASETPRWSWWQWLLVVALLLDVFGGVPANGLGTAKRLYHSPSPPGASAAHRLLRHPVGFAALHLHPFLLAAAFADVPWTWAWFWYSASLLGSAVVVALPAYLQRPTGLSVVAFSVLVAALLPMPLLWWVGPLLVLKLVLAHAVVEEPYRPAAYRALVLRSPGSRARS